jgi:hypothetical protein
MIYPKIETLYNRNEEFKVTNEFRCPEFALVKSWLFTEKIDGTNVRVVLFPDGLVEYRGRTDYAQMHPNLIASLNSLLPATKLQTTFEPEDGAWPLSILYGEGYGPKIQKGGRYRDDISYRLFDVRVGDWWLNWTSVEEIAAALEISTVPVIGLFTDFLPTCRDELADLFTVGSVVAQQEKNAVIEAEGIVARTDPLLFDRRGNRVMWKLKFKDF